MKTSHGPRRGEGSYRSACLALECAVVVLSLDQAFHLMRSLARCATLKERSQTWPGRAVAEAAQPCYDDSRKEAHHGRDQKKVEGLECRAESRHGGAWHGAIYAVGAGARRHPPS